MKRTVTASMTVTLVLGLAFAAQDPNIAFQFGEKTITARDFEVVSGRTVGENGGFEFSGHGTPRLTIELPEQGLTLRGNTASGLTTPASAEELAALGRAGTSPRGYFVLRRADVQGDAKVILDTLVAFNAQTARAEREKRSAPAPRPTQDHMEIDTASFSYTGTATLGTLTVPGEFTLNERSEGTKQVKQGNNTVPQSFIQTLTANGVSGVFGLDPTGKVNVPLRTGTIVGLVTFHLVRNVKTAGVDEAPITLDGTADQIDIDLTKPERTLIARGHVKVSGVNGPLEGSAAGDILTVVLDADLKPVSAELRGDPTHSTYRDRGKGGGGR